VVQRVVGEDGDPVVLLETQVQEGVGDAVALVVQLGVGEAPVAEDERRLVREVVAGTPEEVGDDPPVGLVVSGPQEGDALWG